MEPGEHRFPKFPAPVKAGAGLKHEHVTDILAETDAVGFFEVHAENYMGQGGAPHAALNAIRERYPLFIHGVGLSIGAAGPLDQAHLSRLSTLVDRYEPLIVSEHLAWSTHDTTFYNDLLPVPYNADVLQRVVEHIDEVQTRLKRQILLENPSTYVAFQQTTMSETDFIRAIVKQTGCGLLLDCNNVHVSATNHKYSAFQYLADFPLAHVKEIHLAGHATETDEDGSPLLIDAHDREVSAEVWDIYAHVTKQAGRIPTLIEWDNDVPAWPVLKKEAELANIVMDRCESVPLRKAS